MRLIHRYRDSGDGTWSQLIAEDISIKYLQRPIESTNLLERELLAQISSAQLNQYDRSHQRSTAKLIVGLPIVKLLMQEEVSMNKKCLVTITVGQYEGMTNHHI